MIKNLNLKIDDDISLTLIDSAQVMIAYINKDAEILYANAFYCSELGYTKEEIIGKFIYHLDPNISKQDWSIHWEELKKEKSKVIQTQILKPNKEPVDVELTLSAVNSGDEDYLVAIGNKKNASKVLVKNQIRQNFLLEEFEKIAQLGGWEVNLVTGETFMTNQVYELYEISKETIIPLGEGINFYHPESRPTISKAFDKLVETGESYDLDLKFITAKGKHIWIRSKGEAVYEDGKITKVRGIVYDITAQKLTEKKLKASRSLSEKKERQAKLLSSIKDITDIEFNNLEDVCQNTMELIAKYSNWPVAHIYFVDDNDNLTSKRKQWYFEGKKSKALTSFITTTENNTRNNKTGLTEKVKSNKKTKWVANVNKNPNFIRNDEANELGIIGGFITPIIIENKVIAVMEFFSYAEEKRDNELILITEQVIASLSQGFDNFRFQKELAKSENILTSVINSPENIIIIAYDTDYNYISYNDAHRKEMKMLWGADVELGKSVFDYIPKKYKKDRAKVKKYLDLALKGMRFSIIDKYGTDENQFYYQLDYNPIFNDKKKVIGITLFAVNITEQKEKENEIISTNATMVSAEIAGNLGSWNWNLNTDELKWSDNLSRIHGLKPTEFDGTFGMAKSFFHPDDKKGIIENIEKIKKDKISIPTEFRIILKSGVVKNVFSNNKIILNEKGEIDQIVGIIQDITAQKAAQKTMKEYEILFNSDIIGVMKTNFSGDILNTNDAFLKIIGYTQSDYKKGRINWSKMTPPEWDQSDEEAIKQLAETGVAKPWEKEYYKKDGSKVPVVVGVTMLEKDSDECICFILDNSKQKEAVEELKETNQELEQFTYVATHDIKAPITNISNYLGFLKDDADIKDGRSKQAIDWIEKSIIQCNTTIQDLVNVTQARKEAQLPGELINLNTLVTETLTNYEADIVDKKIALRLAMDGDSNIIFPRIQAQSIINNLINNAIKYRNPKRKLKIEISSKSTKNFHVLFIKDNGTGIDLEKNKTKIFELFKRAHNNEISGSGLGLYMTKMAIEKQGGKIEVSSQLGKGSTFKVYFKK